MNRDPGRTTIFVDATPTVSMGQEAARLTPVGCARAVIDWSLPQDDTDDPMPPGVALVLCRTLLASGRIAFRCDAAPAELAQGDRYLPEPAPSALAGIKRFLLQPDVRFGTLVTSDERSALALFGFGGWTVALQAALVIDQDAGEPPEAVHRLQRLLDWRDYEFPPYVKALFGSGHDGGFSVLSCAHEERMLAMLSDLRRFAMESGIAIEPGQFRRA